MYRLDLKNLRAKASLGLVVAIFCVSWPAFVFTNVTLAKDDTALVTSIGDNGEQVRIIRIENDKDGGPDQLKQIIVATVLGGIGITLLVRLWSVDWKGMEHKIDDLYTWHDKTDADGVPVWYVRRSLEVAISDLSVSINKQTKIFEILAQKIDKIDGDRKI